MVITNCLLYYMYQIKGNIFPTDLSSLINGSLGVSKVFMRVLWATEFTYSICCSFSSQLRTPSCDYSHHPRSLPKISILQVQWPSPTFNKLFKLVEHFWLFTYRDMLTLIHNSSLSKDTQ